MTDQSNPSPEPGGFDPAARWPIWMLPARLVGRSRPAILAAAAGDAIAVNRHLPALVRLALPLLVVALAAAVAVSPLFAGFSYPAAGVDWLRATVDFSFSDAPLFLLLVCAIAALSPAAGVLVVLAYGAVDIPVAFLRGELVPVPMALLGRLVALWLLWLVAVEIPVVGRMLALSVRHRSPNRIVAAVIAALATGALTWVWTQAVPVLIRPLFTWAEGWEVQLSAVVPVQTAGLVFALVAGGAAAFRVLVAGAYEALDERVLPEPSAGRASLPVIAIARRLVTAALLTVALGGLITAPLDAAVLFVVLAGARPLARAVGRRTPIGALVGWLPLGAQLALAAALSFGVSVLFVGGVIPPRSVTEFFSLIVAFGVGLFLVELVTMPVPTGGSAARGGTIPVVAVTVPALLLLTLLAPVVTLADNCSGFADCWGTPFMAALVGGALPLLGALSGLGDRMDDQLRKWEREREDADRKENPWKYKERLLGWHAQQTAANVPDISTQGKEGR